MDSEISPYGTVGEVPEENGVINPAFVVQQLQPASTGEDLPSTTVENIGKNNGKVLPCATVGVSTIGNGSNLPTVSVENPSTRVGYPAGTPTDPGSRSGCWNPFRDIRAFIANVMLINICSIGLISANVGALRTLEKRFGLTATQSGFFHSVNDVTNICLVMIVGMIGRKSHKPRLVGLLVLIGGIGSKMFASPYVLYPREDTTQAGNSTDPDKHAAIYCGHDEAALRCDTGESVVESNEGAYVIMVISLLLVALSNVGLMAVSTTYIDENCPEDKASLYLGVSNSAWSIGPVVGFVFGGLLLGVPENLKDSALDPEDPEFIGCWWLLPVLLGITLIVSAITLMFFPKHMEQYYVQKEKRRQEASREGKIAADAKKNKHQTKTELVKEKLKDNLGAILRLVRNRTYMMLAVSTCFSWYLVQYYIQMSKYMELKFHVSAGAASIINGVSGSLMAAVGLILVGVLASRCRWRLQEYARAFVGGSIAVTALTAALWPLSCDQPTLVGAKDGLISGVPCVSDLCGCSADNIDGACVQIGDVYTVYPTACYAGCQRYHDNETYSNCSCLHEAETVTAGLCGMDSCSNYMIYAALTAAGGLTGGFVGLGQILLSLRLIDEDLKTIALSFTSFLSSAFVFIPGPLLFGAMFDSICDLWETSCGEKMNCLMYDMTKYTDYLHGVIVALVGMGVVTSVIMYMLMVRQIRRGELRVEDPKEENKNEIKIKL